MVSWFYWLPHLVVTGDGNVHISKWRVCVAQSNGGDVHVGSLSQWLMVSTGICHDQEAGLPESCLDLIGECSRGETTMEGGGTGGRGELQHSSLQWTETITLRTQILLIILLLNFSQGRQCGSGHYQTPVMGRRPHGVSENPAWSLLHTSDTWTPTSVPGFNRVLNKWNNVSHSIT